MSKSYLVTFTGCLINVAWAFHPPHGLAASGEEKAIRRPSEGEDSEASAFLEEHRGDFPVFIEALTGAPTRGQDSGRDEKGEGVRHLADAENQDGERSIDLLAGSEKGMGKLPPPPPFSFLKTLKYRNFKDQPKYYGKYITLPEEVEWLRHLTGDSIAHVQKRRLRSARGKVYLYESEAGNHYADFEIHGYTWSKERIQLITPLLRRLGGSIEIKGGFRPGPHKIRRGQKIDTLYIRIDTQNLEEAKIEFWNLCNANAKQIKVFTGFNDPEHIHRLVSQALSNRWGRLESFVIYGLFSSETKEQRNEFARQLFPAVKGYPKTVRHKTLSKFVAHNVPITQETLKLVLASQEVLQEVGIHEGPLEELAASSLPRLECFEMKQKYYGSPLSLMEQKTCILPFAKTSWVGSLKELRIFGRVNPETFKGKPVFSLLEKIHISGGGLEQMILEEEQVPHLKTLIINGGHLDIGVISEALAGWGQNLTYANFKDQDDEGWTQEKIIPLTIKSRKNLEEIHLGSMYMPAKELRRFFGGNVFPKLRVLDLSENRLSAKGLKAFFIKNHFPALKVLHLERNDLGTDFFDWLCKLRKKGKLPKAEIYG